MLSNLSWGAICTLFLIHFRSSLPDRPGDQFSGDAAEYGSLLMNPQFAFYWSDGLAAADMSATLRVAAFTIDYASRQAAGFALSPWDIPVGDMYLVQ